MMRTFKENVTQLLEHNFNLILYGENGCGKTTLIKDAMFSTDRRFLVVSISHFVNIENFFDLVEEDLKLFFRTNTKNEIPKSKFDEYIKLKKFSDLYDILDDLCQFYEVYLIIDGLNDISICTSYKKYFYKILALNANYPNIKLVFISNFDLSKSEISHAFDFSTFVTLCYPNFKSDLDYLREIISSHYDRDMYNKNFDDTLNKCIQNYKFSFVNLNEYILCCREILDEYCLNIKDNYEEMLNYFNSMSIEKDGEGEKVGKKISSNNMPFKKMKQGEKIHHQILVSPIHIKNFDSVSEINSKINMFYTTKNLTESLSTSQKLLLFAAFLATSCSPKHDAVIFKNVKKTLIKQTNRKNINQSLKSKVTHAFNIQRLMAIYSSLKMIVDDSFVESSEMNIELIADINSLINLGLIRNIKFNEYNFLARKFMANIGIDFALKLAEGFDIKIGDFIKMDQF